MSHIIRFNRNNFLDYLTDNWKPISDEFSSWFLEHEKTHGPKIKANVATAQTQSLPLYTGMFKSVVIKIEDTLLLESEARSLHWENFGKTGAVKTLYREQWLEQMPTLHQWVVQHYDIIGSVQFNTSMPGSLLRHHFGNDPKYLRLHLTLKEAPGCMFNIENEIYEWKDGDLIGFDDAIVYHGTKHTGTEERVILVIDVLKSAVKEHAVDWSIREGLTKRDRSPVAIYNWYPQKQRLT